MKPRDIPPGKTCRFNIDEECVHYIAYADPSKGLCLKLMKPIVDCTKLCGINTEEVVPCELCAS